MITRSTNRIRTVAAMLIVAGLTCSASAQEKQLVPAKQVPQPVKGDPAESLHAEQKAAPQFGQPGAMMPSPLVFEKIEHDWGNVSDLQKVSHSFKFKNTSDQRLKITAAASCGCTVAALAKDTFEPGEDGEITATFDPHGRPGAQSKTVTITIVDPPGKFQQTVLTARCNVKAMVVVEPNKVFANEVDHRVGNTQKVTITGRKEGFQVVGVETNNPATKATLGAPRQAVVDGDNVTIYDVDLQILPGAPIGTMQAQLTIQTNDDRVTVPPLFFGGDIVGDIRSTPPSAFFHQVFPNSPFSTQIRLDNRAGTGFRITGVDVEGQTNSQLVTSITPMGEGEGMYYIVKLSGVGPTDAALVSGALVIKTDHEGETIRIPFNGAVRMRGTAGGVSQPVLAPQKPVAGDLKAEANPKAAAEKK